MKRVPVILGIILLVVIVGGILSQSRSVVEVTNGSPKIVEKEVILDPLEEAIKEALTASSTEIENAVREAAEATRTRMEREVELQVRREHKEALDGQIEALEKEIGVY